MSRLVRSAVGPLRDWRTQVFPAAVFALLLLLVSMVGAARAATNVSGTISSNQTWDLAGSPYVMTVNEVVLLSGSVTLKSM